MPVCFGLFNINKPSGKTSRWAVDQIQRLVRPAKVGHAGTLDPLASGVLVVAVGPATRLIDYVQQMPKRYRAEFRLGCTSDTEDVDGIVTQLANARGAKPCGNRCGGTAFHGGYITNAAGFLGAQNRRPPGVRFGAKGRTGRRCNRGRWLSIN